MSFTDSLSSNAITIQELKQIAAAELAKAFWDLHFKSEDFSDIYEYGDQKWEIRLLDQREKTINASNDFFTRRKDDLSPLYKTVLKESICFLYHSYRRLFLWKITYDRANDINLLQEGELYAPNYFTVRGEFNDLAWVKSFLLDSGRSIESRFHLGCSYWLESETELLWAELKGSNSISSVNRLLDIKYNNEPLIVFRRLYLERNIQSFENHCSCCVLYLRGAFHKAAEWGYEQAMYNIWQKIPQKGRFEITQQFNNYCNLIDLGIDYPRDKACCFLYSQLSEEQKQDLLVWTIEHNRPKLWLGLLLSPYNQAVRSEIFELVYQLPIQFHLELLKSLVGRIKLFKFPSDIEVFRVLLNEVRRIFLEHGEIMPNLGF